jgi:hypothetical protein
MKKNQKKAIAKKKSRMSGGEMMAVGAGIAALGAGAYCLLGPKAKAHQKKASALMAKMKKEIASEIKKAKTITVPLYHQAVDMAAENYSQKYKMHEKEIKALAQRLKGEWKGINKTVKKSGKSLKKKKA